MRRVAFILLAVLACIGYAHVLFRAYHELQGGFHSDASIYMVVARGILHGLTPYADLFENKAPGVFLLGALSILLTGGTAFLSWFQAAVIAFFPWTILLPGLALTKNAVARLLLFAFSCALAIFVAEYSGQLLPESWGALFSMLFLGYLAMRAGRESWSMKTYAILAGLLLVATGIKEPFFLSTLGAALMLTRGWNDIRRLGIVAGVAGVAGLAGLLLLGQLHAYITIHLAHMLGFHIFHPWGTVGVPWWIRLNDLPRIARLFWVFSPAFMGAVLMLWGGALLTTSCSGQKLKDQASMKRSWPLRLACRLSSWNVTLFILATWSNTAAVGFTGDFYFHHFVFAVPLLAACALKIVRDGPCGRATMQPCGYAPMLSAAALVFGLLLSITLIKTEWDLRYGQKLFQEWAMPKKRLAIALDQAMDRCGYDRYLNLIDRPEGFYGFPTHLPYGPIFTQYGRFIGALPEYVDAFALALTTAPVAVLTSDDAIIPLDQATREGVLQSFTQTPPPCAADATKADTSPYRILFRSGAR
jgi:hypothetical protein